MMLEEDNDGIIWKPYEDKGLTLDFSEGSYIELMNLAIWIADQEGKQKINDPRRSVEIADRLTKFGLVNDGRVLVDKNFRNKIKDEFKSVQIPDNSPIPIKGKSIEVAEKIIKALKKELAEEYSPSVTGHSAKIVELMLRVFNEKPDVNSIIRLLELRTTGQVPDKNTIKALLEKCFPSIN